MKRHRINLSHTPKCSYSYNYKEHCIGGLTEPKNVVLWLSNEEYKKLNKCLLGRVKEKSNNVVLALYDFTHSKVCSKHHKYKIWREFEGISDIDFRYMGSSER